MKLRSQLASVLVFLYAVITLPAAPKYSNNHNTINAVLGDVSFVQKFGTAPNASTNERLRIQTHLAYVEALLRKADVSHLPSTLRESRAALLDKLHDYRLAGEFPTNLDFPQKRRPCFIDAAGNICAVGFLIEQTAGRALAERINAAHRYDFLADMHVPELTAWVEASGLTARECAMIQPGYGPPEFDPDFRIISVSPSTTSATGTSYIMDIQFVGLLDSFYQSGNLRPFGSMSINFNNTYRFGLVQQQWSTSATLANRWNGRITTMIPAQNNITAGTYQIRLIWVGGTSNGFYTSTTFTVSPATSVRDLTLPSPITISPNPTNDVCMLALPENELHRVRLTNSLGTAVATLSEAGGYDGAGCERTHGRGVFRGSGKPDDAAALGAEDGEVLMSSSLVSVLSVRFSQRLAFVGKGLKPLVASRLIEQGVSTPCLVC
jgi:hypothetical protein